MDVLLAALCVEAGNNVDRIDVGLVGVGRREQVHVRHAEKVHVVGTVELRCVAVLWFLT